VQRPRDEVKILTAALIALSLPVAMVAGRIIKEGGK
jgi:hypothetical protein